MASVFYPSPVQAATNLRTAMLFTRINAAFAATPTVQNTFSLGYLRDILLSHNTLRT